MPLPNTGLQSGCVQLLDRYPFDKNVYEFLVITNPNLTLTCQDLSSHVDSLPNSSLARMHDDHA